MKHITLKIKSAKSAVMQPKHRPVTIKPDKGKGSYDRAEQIDWVYEYHSADDDFDIDNEVSSQDNT